MLDSAREKKEGGSPPASDVQNSSSLTQRDAAPAVAGAELSGENNGKVLQKDSKSDRIDTDQSRKGVGNEPSEKGSKISEIGRQSERNGKKGHTRTSKENENRSSVQERKRSKREIAERILLQRSGRGIDTESKFSPRCGLLFLFRKNFSMLTIS